MNPLHVKIALLGMPEPDRMALLQLPADATAAEAASALQRSARRDIASRARAEGESDETLAARRALERKGSLASADDLNPDALADLLASRDAAQRRQGELAVQIEGNALDLLEHGRRTAGHPDARRLLRENFRYAAARVGTIALIACEVLTALVTGVVVSGIDKYPNLSLVPASLWGIMAGTALGMLLPMVAVPMAAARALVKWRMPPAVRAVGMVLGALLAAGSLGSVVLLRVQASMHATGPAADIGRALGFTFIVLLVVWAMTELEIVALRAHPLLEKMTTTVQEDARVRAELVAARQALADEQAALTEQIAAPSRARADFESKLVRVERQIADENLEIEEREQRGLSVFKMMQTLTPAGRAHLSSIFVVVERTSDDAVEA